MAVPVIAGFLRTPFAKAHRGALKDVRPDDFSAEVVRGLISKNNIVTGDLEDLLLGCAYPEGEQGNNIGRIITYLSGLPNKIPASTTNRLCGSSMQTIHMACGSISMGAGEIFLCGGVESMSRVMRGGFNFTPNPLLSPDTNSPQKYNGNDAYISMGTTAENVAKKYSISREEQEVFAMESHKKAAYAYKKGYFEEELISIETPEGTLIKDECIRENTNLESMKKLKPAFIENGTVTAATSSPLTDGAAFTIICSEDYALKNNMTPIAKITSTAVTGCSPSYMGMGPVEASKKVLKRANIEMNDIGVIELNEAFSSQSLAVINSLNIDTEKVNVDGGALSIGHPLGASGARITGKAAMLMNRLDTQYSLATMCIGGGMGIATILENYN
ncbi:MAG: 3-ketoacyl-CoA thiolase [Methanobacteriota archaeon]|nr:MAG: 3-ketoacyl-CoA thiolase [Euryarchaeota archaeon]